MAEMSGDDRPLAPGLHLVATPIGNLADLSPRALSTLKAADLLICEDTRVTGRLLRMHGVTRSLHPYHEHNAAAMRPRILKRLGEGASVVLASDAGTPLVSDPGYKLVRAVIEAGFEVLVVPGPSAALAALVVSGLPTDRFLVAGFLPAKRAARRRSIEALAEVPATQIWFEAPPRLRASLADLVSILGPRPAAVARELTKRFEEVRRGRLGDLAEHYEAVGAPRGELVIVVGPPTLDQNDIGDDALDAALSDALRGMSPSAAAARVAAATGRSKRELYRRLLARRSDEGAST